MSGLWKQEAAVSKGTAALVVIIAAAGVLCAQTPSKAPKGSAKPPAEFQIDVDVNQVVVEATVRDREGRFAPDLTKDNFELFEDNVRQDITYFRHEDVPVTIGLVIDHSGSMRNRLTEVTTAAETFVRSSNQSDEMFVVNFNENVNAGLAGKESFSNDPDELGNAISRQKPTGETALYDAIGMALNKLQSGTHTKKALIVISDGGDNASKINFQEILRRAEESSAQIYTIGIYEPEDPDQNPGVLRHLSKVSGGDSFFPEKLDEVVSVCQHIATDLRNQYTLGYASSNKSGSMGFRNIRVTAKAPGSKLTVRARSGYLPAPVQESAK